MAWTEQDFLAYKARSESARKSSTEVVGPHASSERESALHDAILDTCKARRWIAFHGSMAHKAMRTLGEPDFTILADNGRVFFIEAKTATGKLSPEQLGIQLWAKMLGHTIHVCRSAEAFLEIVTAPPATPAAPEPQPAPLPESPRQSPPENPLGPAPTASTLPAC